MSIEAAINRQIREQMGTMMVSIIQLTEELKQVTTERDAAVARVQRLEAEKGAQDVR